MATSSVPTGWLDGIKLPRKAGGRKVVRTELEPSQILAIVQRLKEPYSTLVLFLGLLGRRIEEARGMQPSDLDDNNILHIRRVIYNGRVEELEESNCCRSTSLNTRNSSVGFARLLRVTNGCFVRAKERPSIRATPAVVI